MLIATIHLDLVKYLITLELFLKENDPVIDRRDYKVSIFVKVKLLSRIDHQWDGDALIVS